MNEFKLSFQNKIYGKEQRNEFNVYDRSIHMELSFKILRGTSLNFGLHRVMYKNNQINSFKVSSCKIDHYIQCN